jgi:arabinose-5-phosphate isomerase
MSACQPALPADALTPPPAHTAAPADLSVLSIAQDVFATECNALRHVASQLSVNFVQAVGLLKATKGRIIITGMGKSGLVGKKIAATFSSTGSPAYFLHPAEGSHGDFGVMMPDDVVIAISYSGETPELLTVLPLIKRMGLPLIAMTRAHDSTLGRAATVTLNIEVPKEACPMNLAPTASTTATMAMGDALAVALLTEKGFTENDFALVHPAGALGKRLLYRVSDVMHTADLPRITTDTPFLDALMEMTNKRLGLALVVDSSTDCLLGVLTDGDVRRALQQQPDLHQLHVAHAMTPHPKTIAAEAMAAEALHVMESYKITALVIVNAQQQPTGVLHLHDLLKAGIR